MGHPIYEGITKQICEGIRELHDEIERQDEQLKTARDAFNQLLDMVDPDSDLACVCRETLERIKEEAHDKEVQGTA